MSTNKRTNPELDVAQVLAQMQGERWEYLRARLARHGLRALLAETSIEEVNVIQDKVAELRQDPTLAIQQSHPKHTIQRMTKPALQQVQEAIRMSIEHATSLHWPPLYQEPLEA